MEIQTSTAIQRGRLTPRLQSEPQRHSMISAALSVAKMLPALQDLKLTPLGLASGQDWVLQALQEDGPLSVGLVADKTLVPPSTVSKMVDRLVAKGLVERNIVEHDARKTNLKLTADGERVCTDLGSMLDQLNKELLSSLAEEEARTVCNGLTILEGVVTRRLRRLR